MIELFLKGKFAKSKRGSIKWYYPMKKAEENQLKEIAKTVRYYSLRMSMLAGSGHPTSALSSADLMSALFISSFCYDINNPSHPNNDRLILSKGHASVLFYTLFALSGGIKRQELDNYRKLESSLEGHPTPHFKFTEAATGSLGQGLSIGVGLAINGKYLDNLSYRTFVLLGDGEMAEGSTWEAINLASYYRLDNLVGILDVNRLGQSQQTMLGHDTATYRKRLEAFNWKTKVIDGHDFKSILKAVKLIGKTKGPYMIIAKTLKGKGVSFLEDKDNWHGKAVSKEQFIKAIEELGRIDKGIKITLKKPRLATARRRTARSAEDIKYRLGEEIPTRKAYGLSLARLGSCYPQVISLDGDVKNSTYAEIFKEKFPQRFFEMYIAEQNMVGVAVGLSKRGKIPFVSTFAAFLTRAFDQIRMAAISSANIKFCGSHSGVSIGEDGPSQMGLEDIALFRAIYNCSVLYPADAVATDRLIEQMIKTSGMAYIRTTRPPTAVIYDRYERFYIGGAKVHRVKGGKGARAIVVAAGITLHEALKAQKELVNQGIETVVIDCYSIKPIDEETIKRYAVSAGLVVTVEDHWFDGGLGDALLNVFANSSNKPRIIKLAITEMPRSGKPAELLSAYGIDKKHIVEAVRKGL